MGFEAAVRHEDAAKHCGGRIVSGVLGLVIAVLLAAAFIGRTATNGDFRGVREVPHDLLSHGGVQLTDFIRFRLGETATDVGLIPPKTPAGMEVNVVAGHIDHDGGVFRNVDEFEIDTTITGGGKLLTGEREHLRGGFAVSGEGDELLVVLYALAIDGGKAAIIGELKADGIRRFIVVVLVTGGGAFRRLSRGIDGTRVLQFGQGGGKLGLEVGFRIVRVIGAVHVLQRVCCVEGDVIVLLPIALSGHDRRAARVVAPLGLTAGDRSLVLVTLSGTCHRFVAILGIPCRVALADKAALAICADVTLHITRRKAVDTGVGTTDRKHGFPVARTELRTETHGTPTETGTRIDARRIRSLP